MMRQNILFQEAPNCTIGQAKTCEGQGLFAFKTFQPGEIIADYSK